MVLDKNGKKKNLRWHFGELSDKLQNRIWSVYKFGLVSLFNDISNFMDYLMPNPSL